MKASHFQMEDLPWEISTERTLVGFRWKEILSREKGGSEEFVFGLAELAPGSNIPLHKTRQALTGYILSGKANLRLGARRVEVEAVSAFYFPADKPKAMEVLGAEPLRYLYAYACEKNGQDITWEEASEVEAAQVDIQNFPGPDLWALSEDYEQWSFGEPSKGRRMRAKYFFGEKYFSGQAFNPDCEMHVGVAELDSSIHYTLHYHKQPEIYYILSGTGIIYAGDQKFEVRPGSTLYLGKEVVHGADITGDKPLKIYYIYGCESTGQAITWTAVEDTYTDIRRPK